LRANPLAVSIFACALLAQGPLAHSRELFDDEKVPTLTVGQSVYGDDTIGNYQLYAGNGYWQFEDASISWSGGRADSIPMGVLRLTRWEGDEIVAAQTVIANLRASNGAFWSGAPCEGDYLHTRKRGRGRYDDCMAIGVNTISVGPRQETFLNVTTVQSNSGGRYYSATVLFNVSYLGFQSSNAADWTSQTIKTDPEKASVFAKLMNWAERYQDAAAAQIDYRKPADTFAAVPKLKDVRSDKAQMETAKPRVPLVNGRSASYVFCETTKRMELEGTDACPSM